MSQQLVASTQNKVEVNKRPWELPLAILLWLYVVGSALLFIFFLVSLGDSSSSPYDY